MFPHWKLDIDCEVAARSGWYGKEAHRSAEEDRDSVTYKLKLNEDCKPGNVRFCNAGYALQVPFSVGRQVGSNPAFGKPNALAVP
jgi:hypothetical protein